MKDRKLETAKWLLMLCTDKAEHMAVLELVQFARHIVSTNGFYDHDDWQSVDTVAYPISQN